MRRQGESITLSLSEAGRGEDAQVFSRVLAFGKFARVSADSDAARRLILEGLLTRNATGHAVLALADEVTAGGEGAFLSRL